MKQQVRAVLFAVILGLSGWSGAANAALIFSDVSMTSNSVTFTVNGDMSGYTIPSIIPNTFEILYTGDIWAGVTGYTANTWSNTVFDGMTIQSSGNTGDYDYSGPNRPYTWTQYTTDLAAGIATSRQVTVTFGDAYLNPDFTAGEMVFIWGTEGYAHTELGRWDGSQPVPEPATVVLLGSGLAGLAFIRRKGSRK
ncbi:MAG: PEP-CTERM sorting domain-containing protein [Deltaproteobacteria bacterium]|nr:PEP-CTERM sorting domain-containing protein [Deltaproteobacteria bacterium]